MKAVKLFSPFNFRIEDIDNPEIAEDEILVKVKSVGICRSDCHYYHYGKIGNISIKEPIIIGHEFSGQVEYTGKKVRHFFPGNRVAVEPALSCGACEFCKNGNPNLCPDVKFCGTPPINGALSEFYIAKEEQLFKIPEQISFDEGAILEPLGVAIHSFNLAKPKINQRFAILGCGSIGLLLLQLLRNHSAKTILGTDLFDYRLKIAEEFGTDITLNSRDNSLDYNEYLNQSSNSFDVVFEASGDPSTIEAGIRLLKPGGQLIIIGIFNIEDIPLNTNLARRKGLTVKFVRRMKHTYPVAIDLALNGRVDLLKIRTHNFKFEDTAKAFDIVDSYKDNVIKAIINP